MVHDFFSRSEPALAIVQSRSHFLKLGHDGSLDRIELHASGIRTFRRFAASRNIAQVHDEQGGQPLLDRGARGRRTIFQAFCQSAAGMVVGEVEVLQNLCSRPFSRRSLGKHTDASAAGCIVECPL